MLEFRGVSVVEAVNGETAMALAENVHLDLILIAEGLPLLDGFEATRRIRELTFARGSQLSSSRVTRSLKVRRLPPDAPITSSSRLTSTKWIACLSDTFREQNNSLRRPRSTEDFRHEQFDSFATKTLRVGRTRRGGDGVVFQIGSAGRLVGSRQIWRGTISTPKSAIHERRRISPTARHFQREQRACEQLCL